MINRVHHLAHPHVVLVLFLKIGERHTIFSNSRIDGAIEQSIYLPRYKLFLVAKPAVLRNGGGDLLLNQLFEDLKQANAITVSCQVHSSNRELINLLKARGFDETVTQLDSRLLLDKTIRFVYH